MEHRASLLHYDISLYDYEQTDASTAITIAKDEHYWAN